MMKYFNRLQMREIALTVGAIVGGTCILVTLLGALFGVQVLVFRSGSMSPTVESGGAALARTVSATDIKRGDIVSVLNDRGVRVTHRVQETRSLGSGKVALTLKGDANKTADQSNYEVTKADRVFWHANKLGYVLNALGSKYAVFIGGLLAAGLLYLGFRRGDRGKPRDSDESDRPGGGAKGRQSTTEAETQPVAAEIGSREDPTRGTAHRSRVMGIVAAVVASGSLVAPSMVSSTMAAWTDQATINSDTFSTSSVPTPTQVSCENAGLFDKGVNLKWTGSAPDDTYLVEIRRASDSVLVGTADAGTATYLHMVPNAYGTAGNTSYVAVVKTKRTYPSGAYWTSGSSEATQFHSGLANQFDFCGS